MLTVYQIIIDLSTGRTWSMDFSGSKTSMPRRYLTNKFWIILICGLLAVSAAAAFLLGRMPARYANIYQNGELVESIDLSGVREPYTITMQCDAGVNIISVEHGRICIMDASCADKSCVRQGWMSSGAAPVVCLPHTLVITLDRGNSGAGDTGVDAVVG